MADNQKQKRRVRKGRDLAGGRGQETVDHWNRKHVVGSPVRYWRALPSGPTLDTRTRSEAFLDDAGQPVVFVAKVSGYVSLWHVLPAGELAREAPPYDLGAEYDWRPIEDCHCCVCGCTEDEPCEGGCWWIEDDEMRDRCSRCEGLPVPERPPMRLVRVDR